MIKRRQPLYGYFFLDCQLASVITAFATHGVVDVPCATVGTLGQSRHSGLVMSSPLGGSRLGLSSFRMCHFYLFKLFFCSSN